MQSQHRTARLCTWLALWLLIAAGTPLGAAAQAPQPSAADTIYEVRLHDGSTIYGRLESADSVGIVIVSVTGVRFELKRTQIRSFHIAAGQMEGNRYWGPDPNPTRLFFAPTGRSLRAGDGYVGVYMILFPMAAYGITDRLTIAGGAPILFGQIHPIYLAPKLRVASVKGADLAVGVLSLLAFGDDFDPGSVGIAYGIGTVGSPNNALTIGVGFGYAGDDFAGQPAIAVGGESRISAKVKLMTENYFVAGETGALLSGGIRFLGDRFSADVGLVGFMGAGETGCCFPILNFAYAFGKSRNLALQNVRR